MQGEVKSSEPRPGVGCLACHPGSFFCVGDDVVQCDATGTDHEVIHTCEVTEGQACYLGNCVEACEKAAQERSYVGMAGKSFSNIGRFQRTFWRDSFVGGILTDRRLEGNAGSGTTGGIDGRFRFLDNYSIEYQALASYTREPNDTTLTAGINDLTFAGGKHTAAFDGEAFWGHAVYASFERDARTWFFDFD